MEQQILEIECADWQVVPSTRASVDALESGKMLYFPHLGGVPRASRIGEPFEVAARHFLPRAKPYARWQARQISMPFPAGSVWVCFSDQTAHAAMSGQYLLEQTLHLPPAQKYDPAASPLAILTRLVGRPLV